MTFIIKSWLKACSLLSSNNNTVQSWAHGNWQFGSIFVAKLRPSNNCHQIAPKCTKSYMEFQKFSGGNTLDPRPGLGKCKGGNPNLLCICFQRIKWWWWWWWFIAVGLYCSHRGYVHAFVKSINQSIKTHFYSAICRERIRGAYMSVRISITAVDRLGRRVAESKLNSVSETRNRVDTITIDRRRRRDRYCLMPQGGSTHA